MQCGNGIERILRRNKMLLQLTSFGVLLGLVRSVICIKKNIRTNKKRGDKDDQKKSVPQFGYKRRKIPSYNANKKRLED